MFLKYLLVLFVSNLMVNGVKKLLVVDRLEDPWANPKYGSFNIWFRKENGRNAYGNINITFLRDIDGNGIEMWVKVYKWADNEFKPTALFMKKPVCDYVKTEMKMLFVVADKNLFKNFVLSCPVKKGFYFVRNFPLNKLPDVFPTWKMKLYVEIRDVVNSATLLNASLHIHIEEVFYESKIY